MPSPESRIHALHGVSSRVEECEHLLALSCSVSLFSVVGLCNRLGKIAFEFVVSVETHRNYRQKTNKKKIGEKDKEWSALLLFCRLLLQLNASCVCVCCIAIAIISLSLAQKNKSFSTHKNIKHGAQGAHKKKIKSERERENKSDKQKAKLQ